MNPNLLSVKILKRFNDAFELNVSAEISRGITIIFGPSGAGKTTLLECVGGLIVPDSGRIALGDEAFFDSNRKISVDVRQRKIGYVFQDLALFPHLTAEQNVQYGIRSLTPSDREQRTASILDSFRIPSVRRRKPAEISGGERQRVALARALIIEPRLLLLDEPLAALDVPTQSKIIEDLRAWNLTHRIPILYVTHRREEVLALGERVIVLQAGRIVGDGKPGEMIA